MDLSLDEIVASRRTESRSRNTDRPQRGGGGIRKPERRDRRERGGPRNGRAFDSPSDSNQDTWTHDKFNDIDGSGNDDEAMDYNDFHGHRRPRGGAYDRDADDGYGDRGVKVSISNLHHDVTDRDLQSVFSQIEGLRSARVIWNRNRSAERGEVIYDTLEDAEAAIRAFDGQLAHGQKFYLRLNRPAQPAPKRSLMERTTFSGSRRNESPAAGRSLDELDPAPEGIDRYVPQRGPRRDNRTSAPRRDRIQDNRGNRGRSNGGRQNGGGGGRGDNGGRGTGGRNRPQKTEEEMWADLDEYMGNNPLNEKSGEGEKGSAPQPPPEDMNL